MLCTGVDEQQPQHQSILATISNRVVRLHKEFYGKGPTKAKTYLQDDLVVILLRGGFTKVEETLLRSGRGAAVIEQRMQFQQVMQERFKDVIREELGREVVAFMSGSHQNPDLIAELFVMAPEEGELLDDAHAGDDDD